MEMEHWAKMDSDATIGGVLWKKVFLKRDSNAGAFLWNFQNFYEHLFWRTSASDCFYGLTG